MTLQCFYNKEHFKAWKKEEESRGC